MNNTSGLWFQISDLLEKETPPHLHDVQVIGVSWCYGVVRLHNLLALLRQHDAHNPAANAPHLAPNWHNHPTGISRYTPYEAAPVFAGNFKSATECVENQDSIEETITGLPTLMKR